MGRNATLNILQQRTRIWHMLAMVVLIAAALAVSTDHSQAEAPVDVVTTDTSITLSWSADGDVKFYWWQPIAGKLERITVSGAKSWTATGLQPESEHEFSFFGAFYGSLKFKTKASGNPPPPPPTPEVSIEAGSDITEGSNATFTLTATPIPTQSISVSVAPSQSGNYGVGSTAKTVTVGTSGTATVTFSTTNDSIDEADGSVTATVDSGTGYTVSSSKGSATLAVADDDVPELSVASDGNVVEGTAASFTISASPTPHTALAANVDISATGSFGVTTGAQTFTIPTSGSKSFTVSTSGDTTDEPDGSIIATLSTGTGYTVSSSAGSASATVSDDDDPPPAKPVVSITAGSDITEGDDASFTVTIAPRQIGGFGVSLIVTESGAFVSQTELQHILIMSERLTFTVSTRDDSTDEPDGTVTATIRVLDQYTVSPTEGSATVAVADNDDPPAQPDTDTDTETDTTSATCELPADAITVAEVTGWRDALDPNKAAAGINRWNRILEALGVDTGTGVSAMTADQAQNVADWLGNTRWDRTARTLAAQDACDTEPPPPPPPADPEISISSSSDITEGGTVTFTLTATPTPTADVDVSVSVTQSGSYTSQAGARTVTITSSGTASFTVSTLDDSSDEPDGSITATVNTGTGYTVSSSAGSATANIADNDDPPLPEISISGGSAVAEGGNVSFTVTATPAPTSALDVSVTVTQSGSFTSQIGTQTVTILATGSTSVTVSTDNDATDEPDGSITATIDTGTGYTVSSSAGTTTVNVADDDDTPQPQTTTPTISIADDSANEGDTITFTVSVNPTHPDPITLNYETIDGTAISHADVDDYTAVSGSLTIPGGQSSATFDVSTTEDDDFEIDDVFTVEIAKTTIGVEIGNDTATGTIINDDTDTTGTASNPIWQCVEWDKDTGECQRRRLWMRINDTYLANVGKDMNKVDRTYYASSLVLEDYYEPREFGIYLNSKPHTTVTVQPVIANPLLVPFVPITPRYLVFTPENYNIPQKVSLHMLPDFNTRTEYSDLVVKLVEFPDAHVYGLYKQQNLWFHDRRRKPIEQELPATRVLHESDTSTSLTYRLRLGARPTAGEDIVVTIKASPDKVNLSAATLTYTHDTWDVWQEVTITPKVDADSINEQVKVTVHIPVPGPQGHGPGYGPRIETFSLTVMDDDVAPQALQQATPTITIADASASEGDKMTFTVSVDTPHTDPITVNYETIDGTAISHADVDDYTAAIGSVTIPAGDSSATFEVSTTEDDNVEIDDQFTVVLSSTQTDVVFGDDTATGTIRDDDTGTTGEPWWNCYERHETTRVCLKQRIVMGVIDTHVDNAENDMKDKDPGYYATTVVNEDDDEPLEFAVYSRRQPHTTFTVELTLSDPELAPYVTITPRYLVFTPGNYSTAQKVSLQLLPNSITGSEKADVVARLVEFPDALVYGLYKQQKLLFVEHGLWPIEQEVPAMRVLQEGDPNTSLTYRLRLGARPMGGEDIVVTITAPPDKVNLSAATLTYTNDNWHEWQTVNITPKDDADTDNDQVQVTVHIPESGLYGEKTETFSITVKE